MKIFAVLFLTFSILSGNLIAQTGTILDSTQSTSQKNDTLNIQKKETGNKKTKESNSSKSNREKGILIGALLGAATGVGAGALLSNFSLEPHSHNEYPFGTAVVCGMVGAMIGGIVGGLVSE